MSRGLFGGMFDFNRDGKLDAFEAAAECQFFHEVLMADHDTDDSDADEDDSCEDIFTANDEIAAAGLDRAELSFMDEDERREALEDAGLDPDDYDDFDF